MAQLLSGCSAMQAARAVGNSRWCAQERLTAPRSSLSWTSTRSRRLAFTQRQEVVHLVSTTISSPSALSLQELGTRLECEQEESDEEISSQVDRHVGSGRGL